MRGYYYASDERASSPQEVPALVGLLCFWRERKGGLEQSGGENSSVKARTTWLVSRAKGGHC